MQFVTIFICLIIFILSWIYQRNLYNPISIFSFIWLCIVMLSSMRLFNMYEASNTTYLIIFVGTISFIAGCLIVLVLNSNIKYKSYNSKLSITNSLDAYGITIIKILASIVIVIYLPYFLQAINILISGGDIDQIKHSAVLGQFEISPFVEILYTYVARPIRYIVIPITLINLLIDKKKDYVLIILTFIIIVTDFITSGSKFAILYIAIQVLFLIKFLSSKKYKLNRNKKIIFTIMVLGIGIILYRIMSINGKEVAKNLYTYISGCVPFLSNKLEWISSNVQLTYGFTSFQGIIRPLISILESIGVIQSTPELFLTAERVISNAEYIGYIGNNTPYNAFVTVFYYFYVDARLLGVFIGSFFYGIACQLSYISLMKNRSRESILLYLIIIQLLSTSMVRFQLSNIVIALTFFYYWLLVKKLKVYR